MSREEMLVVNKSIRVPLKEFSFKFVRSSGPGGQNVNKVNTKVTLSWPVTATPSLTAPLRDRFLKRYGNRVNKQGVLLVSSQRFRDQGRNVGDCLEKLRKMLDSVARPPNRRRATKPTKASRVRRRRQKEALSHKKESRRPVQEQ